MNPAREVRQQHPFSQNPAAPYVPTPFQSTQKRVPFPPSHPPPSVLSYKPHTQSTDSYYEQQRTYRQEASSNPGRHHVISSACHGTSSISNLPSLSSPQQHVPPRTHPNYAIHTCAPTGSIVTRTNYAGSRELPALSSKGGARAGGMAIADILGDSSSHEAPSQYSSPVATSGPIYNACSSHTSPRLSRPLDYPSFRGPQTPEHPTKQFDPRENKNSSGSPRQLNHYQTPETQRFSTPQHIQQPYPRPGLIREERRDPFIITNSNVPSRPRSQPSSFNISQPRDPDRPQIMLGTTFARRTDSFPRPVDSSNYDREQRERISDQQRKHSAIAQREREIDRGLEKQMTLQREKDHRKQHEHKRRIEQENSQREYVQHVVKTNFSYNNPHPKPREMPAWTQSGAYEPPRPTFEPIPEREASISRRPSNGLELPTSSASFSAQPAYNINENQYCPPSSTASRKNSAQDDPSQERRINTQQQHQQPSQQPIYHIPHQNGIFQPHELPATKPIEDSQPIQQRSLLSVQEINRKGRVSPLPQAVQGAQTQADGPSGEPSIKNEFGRMFSGIGSGVGSVLQDPSPTSVQNYAAISGFRREDLEVLQELQNIYKPPSVSGIKRRKLQEEDQKDEGSISVQTSPNGKVKKTKVGNHQHRRIELSENALGSPHLNLKSHKSSKGSLHSLQDPTGKPNLNIHHHHVPSRHHHHHHHRPNQPSPGEDLTITPFTANVADVYLPKLFIRNDAVLKSVSDLPRNHLGNGYYHSTLRVSSKSNSISRDTNLNRGFASVPGALPRFVGKENCTYTVKIPPVYLEDYAREEITSRKALWGTDIYTDDSDVIAACIHAGWFRGAWPEAVDVSMLGLELKYDENGNAIPPDEIMPGQILEAPSDKGPGHIPPSCECHVIILVLPLLDRYASSTRFGIKSREWGFKRDGWKSVHDGLSFMIQSVRFVSGVDGEEGRSKRDRRNIVGKQLQEKEENSGRYAKINSCQSDMCEEKFDKVPFAEMKGLGKGGWWKRDVSIVNESPSSLVIIKENDKLA